MSKKTHIPKQKTLWWTLALASSVGLAASFLQTVERINYAKSPNITLKCDISPIFSCSNVFDAWQSSVFGFPNSLMCIVFFGLTLGVALAGLSTGQIGKKLRMIMQFFAVFFLGFGAWYLWQSTYKIGYICIFCVACYSAVIVMNWAWLKINAADLFKSASTARRWKKFEEQGADSFAWLIYAITVAAIIIFHFW